MRSSPSWESRRDAASQLGRLGDPDSIELLAVALKDMVKHVRASAAEALGRIGHPEAVTPLLGALADRQHEVASAAYKALQAITSQGLTPVIDALKDQQGNIREQAARFLGECGDPSAVDPLIDCLSDGGYAAAQALGKIADRRAIKPLIIGCLKARSIILQGYIGLDALKQIDPDWPKSKEASELVPDLIFALQNEDANVRGHARELLEMIAPDWHCSGEANQRLPQLIAALRSPDPRLAMDSLRSLKAIDPDWPLSKAAREQVNDFINALGSQESSIRRTAAETLGRIGEEAAVPSLIDLLKAEQDIDVVNAVAKALEQIGDVRAVEPLISRLESECDKIGMFQPHCALAEALGSFLDSRAIPVLIRLLGMASHVMFNTYRYGAGDSEAAEHCFEVAYMALQESVANGVPHEIVPVLIAAFEEEQSLGLGRNEIADLLIRIGGDRVAGELHVLIERSTEQPHLITAAKEVLNHIRGVKE